MKFAISLVGCALMLAGCESANQWTTSDPNMQKFSADWAECQRENSAQDEKEGPVITGTNKAKDCMRAKGYADANKK